MNDAQPSRTIGVRPDSQFVLAISLKMYLDPAQTVSWSTAVAELARSHPATVEGRVKLIVLPSLTSMVAVVKVFAGTPVGVGAQDLFWEDRGPYTGAISGADLRQIGCSFVEVGHIERRRVFGEGDEVASRKLAAALRNGLTPVLCIGEDHRMPSEQAAAECIAHLEAVLLGLGRSSSAMRPIIAYEPGWAIGMPEPAANDHVIPVIAALRAWIDARPRITGSPIIYGGSAGKGLLAGLMGATDGLFLGRFAHDPRALKSILDETMRLG